VFECRLTIGSDIHGVGLLAQALRQHLRRGWLILDQ
jgi:hypothetical protein